MKNVITIGVLVASPLAVGCADSGGEAAPEDSTILFTGRRDGVSDLFLRFDDGRVVNLTNDSAGDNWGVWSPDGSSIAFQARRDGNTEVYIMASDGSQPRNLSHNLAHDGLPVWSPDGGRVAFFSSRGLEQTDRGLPGHIYTVMSSGQGLRQITKQPLESTLGPSAWSLDGRYLYAVRLIENNSGSRLIRLQIDTGNEDTVMEAAGFMGAGSLSPDGKTLAVYLDEGGESRIALLDLTRSDATIDYLSPEGAVHYYPRWSSDGRRIVYTALAADGETYDVEAIDVASGSVAKIIATAESELEASWQPRLRH